MTAAEQQRKWRAANPEKSRATSRIRSLRRKYGLTPEQYDALHAAQNGKCALCGCGTVIGKNAHLDHDHRTGRIRGFLCGSCNRGLGYLKDNPKLLQKAAKYVISYDETMEGAGSL